MIIQETITKSRWEYKKLEQEKYNMKTGKGHNRWCERKKRQPKDIEKEWENTKVDFNKITK